MKRAAALALALSLAACASAPPAQAPAQPPIQQAPLVDLSLRLQPGSAWRVVYDRDMAVSENGTLSRTQSVDTYRVDVLAPDLWRWTFETPSETSWTRAISVIECRVDRGGRCVSVRNWDALRQELINAARAQQGQRHAEALTTILSAISAEDAGTFALEGVSILGRIQGLRLHLGDTVRFDTATPNPLGGDPTPMTGQVRLVGVDTATQTARVTFRQEMADSEGGAAVRASMLRTLTNQPGPNPLTTEEAAALVDGLLGRIDSRWLEDGEATIDLATGRVLESTSTVSGRLRAAGGRQELDTTMSGTVILRQELIPAGS